MTDTTRPALRYNWVKLALVASLALNLLFVGAAVTRFVMGTGPMRGLSTSQMQLIPKRFFGELDRARRVELLGVFKSYDKTFRDMRRDARTEIAGLADALDAEPYDAARVKAAVAAFTAKSTGLVTAGGEAALTLIDKLSADERKLLAKHLRPRDGRGRTKGPDKGDDNDGSSDGNDDGKKDEAP